MIKLTSNGDLGAAVHQLNKAEEIFKTCGSITIQCEEYNLNWMYPYSDLTSFLHDFAFEILVAKRIKESNRTLVSIDTPQYIKEDK